MVCSVDTVSLSWWMLQTGRTGSEPLRTCQNLREKPGGSSLDVLLVAGPRHRLGPPALLLLRNIILQTQHRRDTFTEENGQL